MVFSSISFIFFILPLFLIADGLAGRLGCARWRNIVLLVISLLFYTWGESTNVILLIVLGLINYYGAAMMAKAAKPGVAAGSLIVFNLAVLIFFKYVFWLIAFIVPSAAGKAPGLPLGISFFTFHAVSYVVDVYRKDVAPARNLLEFMTYFCMFPHLVAGPIVRYRQVEPSLGDRSYDRELFAYGLYRFLLGFNKKILIANLVAPVAETAFFSTAVIGSAASEVNMADAWLGAVAYTLQIYFDFSAYSDMAIGLAAMAGFRFEENFNRPYSAVSIRDFWHRWHISLSTWFRDYLYIPLGGSRGSRSRTLINLMAVFFLCGLWHGADVTFIIWGLWHGLFLVIERLGLGKALERLPIFLRRFYTMATVIVGWVFFQAASFDQALEYLSAMVNIGSLGAAPSLLYFSKAMVFIVIGSLLCLVPDRWLPALTSRNPQDLRWPLLALHGLIFIVALASLSSGSRNPFIYFNF